MGLASDHGRDAAWCDRCADLSTDGLSHDPAFGAATDRAGLNRSRRKRRGRHPDAATDGRTRRLCGAVARAVSLGLADCGDPRLQAVTVESVEPANGGGACLRVSVSSGSADAELPRRLAAVAARLRADVAATLHRKRTPRLTFAVVPAGAGEGVGDDDGA